MSENNPIKRIGLREYKRDGVNDYSRRIGTTEWTQVEQPPAEDLSVSLMLTRERQSPGEPFHWALSLAPEGKAGKAYQVTGDAIGMQYVHADDINITASDDFYDSYVLAQLDTNGSQRLHYWANRERPPSAPTQADVRENCQGWTVRVIQRLVTEGFILRHKLTYVQGLQQPVR